MMLTLCPTLLPKFKGFCSSPSVIMLFVYMKCRFSLSYRELEEMMQIRGAVVDHSTLQRWVQRLDLSHLLRVNSFFSKIQILDRLRRH